MNLDKERLMATSKMLPLILRFSLPCIAAQLVNLLYSIVDRIFIGHIDGVGSEALAGVGVTTSVIILIIAFSAIVSMGAAPLCAIALGKGERVKALSIMGNGVTLLVFFAIATSIITALFMTPLLTSVGASAQTLPYAEEYLSIYLWGTLFALLSVGLNTFITLQGRADIAMWVVVVGAVMNIALDYIFINIMNMGVGGAALATVISQGVSATLTLMFLCSKSASLRLKLSALRPNWSVVMMTLALGVSPFIMSSTEALVGFALNSTLRDYGDVHIGAMAIIQSALLFAATPLTGMSQGFMPILSYNYGTGNVSRVKECFKYSFIIMTLTNLAIILFIIIMPSLVANIFSDDHKLIELTSHVAPIFFFGMTLFGMQRTCQSTFISLGQAKISILIALLRKVILLIPLIYILSDKFGVMGVYWAESISDGLAAIICLTIFIKLFPRILSKRAKVIN
ncbi:MAG: MATE family efflux transporter [Rikenellaceae bacterium]